jgi:hypothetical protein
VHRITSREDYRAVNALSQDFLPDDLHTYIKQLSGPGDTLIINDEFEKMAQVKIHPRQSSHGGGSA